MTSVALFISFSTKSGPSDPIFITKIFHIRESAILKMLGGLCTSVLEIWEFYISKIESLKWEQLKFGNWKFENKIGNLKNGNGEFKL